MEFAVIDGVDGSYLESFRQANSEEFLWETNTFYPIESRLLVHVFGNPEAQKPLWDAFSALKQSSDASQVKTLLQAELSHLQTDGRVLVLWPLKEGVEGYSWDDLDEVVSKLAEDTSANIISAYVGERVIDSCLFVNESIDEYDD